MEGKYFGYLMLFNTEQAKYVRAYRKLKEEKKLSPEHDELFKATYNMLNELRMAFETYAAEADAETPLRGGRI